MRFSMWLWPYARWGGIEAMGRAARRVEELGFDGVTVSDHIVCPAGPEGSPLGPEWPDWSVLSAHLATVTRRLRIVSCVVIPYRHPLPMAKQIATIDRLSGGRFTLAACVGWWRREFEMLGVPYERRGALTDEYLEAMRVLWTDELPRFSGEFVSFSGVRFEPRCARRPHVPILVAGGDGRRSIERVWRFGDGWMPMGDGTPHALGATIQKIRQGAAARGRDPGTLRFRYTIGVGAAQPALGRLSRDIAGAGGGVVADDPGRTAVLGGGAEQVAEAVRRYADAGFTELAINPAGDSYAACLDRIEWFAAEVLPLTRA